MANVAIVLSWHRLQTFTDSQMAKQAAALRMKQGKAKGSVRVNAGNAAELRLVKAKSRVPIPRIGHILRAQRRQLDLTLHDLAEKVGLTKGFLSDIERDKAFPSIGTLLQLCGVLNIPVGRLFTTGRSAVVPAAERPQIKFGGKRLADFLLTAPGATRLLILWTEIQPGGSGGEKAYSVPCDENFILVISGKLLISFDDEHHLLNAGDALTYSARRLHNFRNPSPTNSTTVLFVMTPPPQP
jgi:transcriptional regulator with XRE-family HTH domain